MGSIDCMIVGEECVLCVFCGWLMREDFLVEVRVAQMVLILPIILLKFPLTL